jgi:hypothetical protein
MSEKSMVDTTRNDLPCRGQLKIKAIDRKGREVYVYNTPNTIVFDARQLMAALLAGDSVSTNKISKIGTGLDITPPLRTDTTLGNEILKVDITSYTFPEVGHVEFTAILDYTSVANGQSLTEAGLFSADGNTMFARQIFGAVTKTNLLQLQFIWRIIFT